MMKCPKCHFENREGKKYCGKCGIKLENICPSCQSVNPLDFRFCDECGHNLHITSEAKPKELSPHEKLSKIQKYLPKDLTQKILSQREKIEGERKQVTVMFCDMVGFTSLTERLGSEQMYSIMDEVYEILIHKVYDYEGTVNELTGDGIMALFGAPIALEDAPQRSIRSALSIHQEMNRFSERIKQERGFPPLKMRIGIHTGPVIVGTLGNDLRVEFNAVGDTINLASRIQGLADPGTTYVTEDTFKCTEGFFRFEALGRKEIKGKEKPVSVYQVIAPSTRRTRFDVSTERGLTPFVGRERELELLLDGYERIKEGRGLAYSIMGEAGVGKSRLLYEFRKAIINEDVTFLEGKCLSYGRGAAYHPIIDILKANFDIHEDEDDEKIREKVMNGLNTLQVDTDSLLPYFLELLSVKDSGIERIQLSPEGKKERIIESLRQIVLKGAEIRPLIMAIEDLHWVDSSTEDALKFLLESIPGIRVLLIFTYRPEFVHTWGGRSYHNQVTLNRLSNRESLMMAAHLLRTREIGRELEDLILSKSEGIPFFIEEFIKSLKDLKIIECTDGAFQITKDLKTVAIPSTIHDVIMARVDSLPQGAKEVLQAGSAIGREFSHDLIFKVMGMDEKTLLSQLSILKDAELIYERGIYPRSTYIFKHALTREVVYDAILTKTKKQLHQRIAEVIEEINRNNLGEYYGILADHYLTADNYAKGADYARLASKNAEKKVSLNDAIIYAKKRVVAIELLPPGNDVEKMLIDTRSVLGDYYIQMIKPMSAKEAVEPILPLALKHNNKRRLSQIYTILGTYYDWCEEDLTTALNYFDKALTLGEEVDNLMAIWSASHWMGHAYADNCEFDKALNHLIRALEISQFTNVTWGIAVMKGCLASTVYNKHGKVRLAYESSLESVRLAEENGDVFSKADAYTAFGYSSYTKGLLDEAEAHLKKGAALGENMGNNMSILANFILGETLLTAGQHDEAQTYYRICMTQAKTSGLSPSGQNVAKVACALIDIINGGSKVNFEALRMYVHNNKLKVFEGWVRYHLAHALMLSGDSGVDESEILIKEAIDADAKNNMMWNLARDHTLYADFFKKRGDTFNAMKQLTIAIDIFRECGADGWVAKAERELAALS